MQPQRENVKSAAGTCDQREEVEPSAERAARIVRAQNREGLISSLDTLDAERTLAEARATLADQDADVSLRQIELFRALGGGWSNSGAAL